VWRQEWRRGFDNLLIRFAHSPALEKAYDMAEEKGYTNDEVYQIGQEHRAIIWLILLQFLSIPVSQLAPSLAKSTGMPLLALPLAVMPLFINIVSLFFVYRLASALKNSPWLYLLLGLIPCISLISLLILSSRAQAALKAHGVVVGLMGARRADLERLVENDDEEDK
jgi:hypothetical protein